MQQEDIENIVAAPLMEEFPILTPEKEMVTKVEIRKEVELIEKPKEKVVFKVEKNEFHQALEFYKGIDCQ